MYFVHTILDTNVMYIDFCFKISLLHIDTYLSAFSPLSVAAVVLFLLPTYSNYTQ